MAILSKYIFKKWVYLAIIVFTILTLLLAIVEIINEIMRGTGTLREIIIKFFIFLPNYFDKLFPITGLITSFILVRNLRDKNELLGLLISGFFFNKIIAVVTFATILLGGIQFIGTSYLGPLLWEKRRDLLQDGDQKFRKFDNEDIFSKSYMAGKMWYKNDRYFISFLYLDKTKKELIEPTVYFYQDKLTEVIRAQKALLKDNSWYFQDGEAWNLTTKYPNVQKFTTKERSMNEDISDFSQLEIDVKILSFPKLVEYLKNLKNLSINVSEYKILLYEKISSIIPTIVFALLPLLGLVNIIRKNNSNVYLLAVFGIVLTHWLVYSYLLELGRYGRINPLFAAFAAQLVALLLTGYLFAKSMYRQKITRANRIPET